MLTEAQVAKARTFPGCGDLTAENAIDKLFAAADGLQASATESSAKITSLTGDLKAANDKVASIPAPLPANVLKAIADAAQTMQLSAVDKQAISPAVSEQLGALLIGSNIGKEGESFSTLGLTTNASGRCLASQVFTILATNGAAPNVGKEPEGQPAPKTAAGAPNDATPTPERIKQLMESTPLGAATLAK